MKPKDNTAMRLARALAALLLILGLVSGTGTAAENDLLPEGLTILEEFNPGVGLPIGTMALVQGDVIIIHAKENVGYRATEKLPLFAKDRLVSLKGGRAYLKFNDGSRVTMGSQTDMVLSRSVYDPKKKSRSSFLSMAFGKARFLVRKYTQFRRREFKIKTPTAVVGVRGSDFAIRVFVIEPSSESATSGLDSGRLMSGLTSDMHLAQLEPGATEQGPEAPETATEVITFEAEVKVTNVEAPDEEKLMGSFKTLTVEPGVPMADPVDAPPELLEEFNNELPSTPQAAKVMASLGPDTGEKKTTTDKKTESSDKSAAGKEEKEEKDEEADREDKTQPATATAKEDEEESEKSDQPVTKTETEKEEDKDTGTQEKAEAEPSATEQPAAPAPTPAAPEESGTGDTGDDSQELVTSVGPGVTADQLGVEVPVVNVIVEPEDVVDPGIDSQDLLLEDTTPEAEIIRDLQIYQQQQAVNEEITNIKQNTFEDTFERLPDFPQLPE